MTDFNKFEQVDSRGLLTCEVCEAMFLDAVDGTLTAGEEAALERHVAGCVMCAEQLAEARRGAAWMEMLKGHRPEPSSMLLSKILAGTTGAASAVDAAAVAASARRNAAAVLGAAAGAAAAFAPETGYPAARVIALPVAPLGWRRRLGAAFSFGSGGAYLQPRLAMTAAMAFFSVALTMTLSGIRVTDLRPSSLHRTVADVSANAARSFQSLRVVNQVESRVSELRQDERQGDRRDSERDPGGPFSDRGTGDAPKQPQSQPRDPQQKPAAPDGSSELVVPTPPQLRQVGDGATETNTEAHPVRKGA